MELVEAMGLRDGGTMCLTVRDAPGAAVRYITIDYALPWDGRPRHVFVSSSEPFSRRSSERLDIGSLQEQHIHAWLSAILEQHFGANQLADLVARRRLCETRDKWLYALAFLRILDKERQQRHGP